MLADDPWWLGVNTGVAVLVLVAIGTALWRVLTWLGTNVVKPLMDRHIALLDRMEVAQREGWTILARQTQLAEQMLAIMRELRDLHNRGA